MYAFVKKQGGGGMTACPIIFLYVGFKKKNAFMLHLIVSCSFILYIC